MNVFISTERTFDQHVGATNGVLGSDRRDTGDTAELKQVLAP